MLLAELFAAAPSAALARHLWRWLIGAWRQASRAAAGEGVAATLFALPVVIVAGSQPGAAELALAGIRPDCNRISTILQEHGALAGNRTFALASALATADAIDVRVCRPACWQRQALAGCRGRAGADAIAVRRGRRASTRFLIGTALAAPAVDLLGTADTTRWAMPLAQELARQLAVPSATVLALPRAPSSPPAALQQGRAAQRAVGAQLFASNAIRRLRASVGEPSAVISAHRCPAAPGGGELRLSLSSVFDPRRAEGFRCPLFPSDAAGDVATMLIELLRDCRVVDVRVLTGVHADRDPATGTTLLFKPDAMPERLPVPRVFFTETGHGRFTTVLSPS